MRTGAMDITPEHDKSVSNTKARHNMNEEQAREMKLDQPLSSLGRALLTSKVAQLLEIGFVFLPGIAVVVLGRTLLAENPGAQQMAASMAILLMILFIWLGLRLRGQTWRHFGLTFRLGDRRSIFRAVVQSFVVAIAAIAAFVGIGQVIANIMTQADPPEMSADFLRGNPLALVITLLMIYVTASFGEEVVYRAFLINRIAELGSGVRRAWVLAVAVSSLAFGLAHYSWGVVGAVQAGFMGLALGVSYLVVGRRLWVTILAHGYMDTILVVQMYLAANQVVTE